jgi:hypothetical protein
VLEFIANHPDGEYKLQLQPNDDRLKAIKKRYYAMVDELAKHAGYKTKPERELFKEQVKQELGGESNTDMIDMDQVSTKIEEMHQLALSHYSYFFKQYDK